MPRAPKYLVVLSGRVLPERSREEVLDNLAALFHVRRDSIEPLLRGRRAPLAKQYARARAEEVRDAIIDAGAQCKIEEVAADESAPDARAAPAEDRGEAQDAPEDAAGQTREDAREGAREIPDEAALMRFVAVNTDYYRKQFAKFAAAGANEPGDARAKFALTWHWPAFFVFFFWAVYRRMWLPAAFNLAGGITLAHYAHWTHSVWLYLAWAFFWPLCANYLYFRHARLRAHDAAAGGVSRFAVLGGVLFVFFLSLTLGERIGGRVIQQKYEALDPAAKTAAILRATLLAALSKGLRDERIGPDISRDAWHDIFLASARRILDERNVLDGWGNEIEVRRDAEGGIKLVSAGADGYFDTDDDIMQGQSEFAQKWRWLDE